MCGIAGWITWNSDLHHEKPTLRAMEKTLIPRGPDENGIWIDKNAALIHRRLIVIDPKGGKQPMIRNGKGCSYIITYNGELYNTRELQQELKSLGYVFQGYSDTETLLYAFIEWQEQCLQRLNGIFSFAIWNSTTKQLFLGRDRIGVKPLFFAFLEKGLLFASEQKAILAHPSFDARIDEQGLAELLYLGPGRTPGYGVFKDIHELKPGYYAWFTRQGFYESRYWLPKPELHVDSPAETVEHVRFLFNDTVERQLVSDVPVCTFLSGGLDSSAITAVAAHILKEKKRSSLHTYSVDYVDNDKNFTANEFQTDTDTNWAKIMAEFVKSQHHSIFLTSKDLINSLITAMKARDLPGMADIDVSLYLFCTHIKKHFTVAISGECADEIFGGYPWFYEQPNDYSFPWYRHTEIRQKLVNPDFKKIDLKQYIHTKYQEAVRETPLLSGESEEETRLRQLFWLNLTRWMPTLLDRKDRMSMATGLEVRVPFCDHRLVEYVYNIPWQLKNFAGYRKGILREALKGTLLEEIRTRPKNPYPKTFDPNYYQLTHSWLEQITNDPQAPLNNIVNTKFIRQLLNDVDEFNVPWFGQLMGKSKLLAYLIQLNYWFEEYNVTIC